MKVKACKVKKNTVCSYCDGLFGQIPERGYPLHDKGICFEDHEGNKMHFHSHCALKLSANINMAVYELKDF